MSRNAYFCSGFAIAAAVLFMSSSARAEDAPSSSSSSADAPHPFKNALSFELLSLANSGVAFQYERFIAPPFSLVAIGGFRHSGGQDFDTLEGDVGIEGRWWVYGKAPFSHYGERAMVGPYFGLREEFGYLHISDTTHSLGNLAVLSESVTFGVRVVAFHRFELTPSFGIGMRSEMDPSGRLAAYTRPEWLRAGITVGIVF